jgi:RNA polymerase sigma-70 factor (ECF subfamily)
MGEGRPAADEGEAEEARLLESCRRGDPHALRELYDREVRAVRRVARYLGLPSETEVDDVTQDVFVMAFRDIRQVRPGDLSAWLFRITSHRVTDRHRRRRVREAFARRFGASEAVQHQEPGPEENLHRQDAEREVSRIVARMRPKKRDVFVLFELEGLLGEEIAARLRIPLPTVWTRLFHARREFARLARALRRGGREEDQVR